MPLSSVVPVASRWSPTAAALPRSITVTRRWGTPPRCTKTRTLAADPTLTATSGVRATAVGAAGGAARAAGAGSVRRVVQAATVAMPSPLAPALRRSAQSRSVGWNATQLRRTTSAISLGANNGLVNRRMTSILSSGRGACAGNAHGAARPVNTMSATNRMWVRMSGPRAAGALEPALGVTDIGIQAPVSVSPLPIERCQGFPAREVVGQPVVFHLLQAALQPRASHLLGIEHPRPILERGQREGQRVGPAVERGGGVRRSAGLANAIRIRSSAARRARRVTRADDR